MSDERLIGMVQEMRKLQVDKEQVEETLKSINKKLDQLRLKDIPEFMAENDIRSITFDGIGRVQLTADVYATMRDKEMCYAWLSDNGYDGLVQPYIQPSTFKAAVKEALKDGQEFPDDIFNITPFTRASVVKA